MIAADMLTCAVLQLINFSCYISECIGVITHEYPSPLTSRLVSILYKDPSAVDRLVINRSIICASAAPIPAGVDAKKRYTIFCVHTERYHREQSTLLQFDGKIGTYTNSISQALIPCQNRCSTESRVSRTHVRESETQLHALTATIRLGDGSSV